MRAGHGRLVGKKDDNRLARAAECGHHQPAPCALEEADFAGKREGRNLVGTPPRAGYKVEHSFGRHRHRTADTAIAVVACSRHDHHRVAPHLLCKCVDVAPGDRLGTFDPPAVMRVKHPKTKGWRRVSRDHGQESGPRALNLHTHAHQ